MLLFAPQATVGIYTPPRTTQLVSKGGTDQIRYGGETGGCTTLARWGNAAGAGSGGCIGLVHRVHP